MNAKNNIYILPGDRIYVYQEKSQKFIAFGATGGGGGGAVGGAQGVFPFGAWRINLAEAVAKAGGLGDLQADPGAVFLYRQEPREVAQLLGADMSRFGGPLVPVIFSISFPRSRRLFPGHKAADAQRRHHLRGECSIRRCLEIPYLRQSRDVNGGRYGSSHPGCSNHRRRYQRPYVGRGDCYDDDDSAVVTP